VGSLVPLCVLAVLFCIAYELTGCLLVPMLLHMIFNATSIVMMIFTDA
jgi:membrane protease YdiL (CAAX protease family)